MMYKINQIMKTVLESVSLKNGELMDEIMSHLFASTDLESLRIHLNIIGLDRKPKVMPLLELIREWPSLEKQLSLKDVNTD